MRKFLTDNEKRQLTLVEYLAHIQQSVTVNDVKNAWLVTSRSIHNDIRAIRERLPGTAIQVHDGCIEAHFGENFDGADVFRLYYQKSLAKQVVMLLYHQGCLPTDEVTRRLHVSASTLYRTIRQMNEVILPQYGVQIGTSPMMYLGKEDNIREFLFTVLLQIMEPKEWKTGGKWPEQLANDLKRLKNRKQLWLWDYAPLVCQINSKRMGQGHHVAKDPAADHLFPFPELTRLTENTDIAPFNSWEQRLDESIETDLLPALQSLHARHALPFPVDARCAIRFRMRLAARGLTNYGLLHTQHEDFGLETMVYASAFYTEAMSLLTSFCRTADVQDPQMPSLLFYCLYGDAGGAPVDWHVLHRPVRVAIYVENRPQADRLRRELLYFLPNLVEIVAPSTSADFMIYSAAEKMTTIKAGITTPKERQFLIREALPCLVTLSSLRNAIVACFLKMNDIGLSFAEFNAIRKKMWQPYPRGFTLPRINR